MIPEAQRPLREQQFFETLRARGLRPPRAGFLDRTLRRLAAALTEAHLRDTIARRAGLAQRVHPRIRLAGTLLLLASVSLAGSLPTLSAHTLLALGALPLARIRAREVLSAGLGIALIFSTLMALPATLNVVSGGSVLLPVLSFAAPWRAGPYEIPAVIGVSTEGLLTAATFLLRTLTSVTFVLCLTLCTRWTDLLASLRTFRLPALFVHTAGMTVRYLHLLLRHSEDLHLGRKTRTVCRTPLASDQMWVGSRIAAAWERSLSLMIDVAEAMTARGFTGDVRFAPDRTLEGGDWVWLLVLGLLCAALHLL